MPSRSLGVSAASGALVTGASQAAKFVAQFASIALLARLLAPSDFGLIAMVLAIVAIGDVLRDFGLSAASIQAQSVSAQQRSNLFWINTTIGAALSVIGALISPMIAEIFDEPRLVPISIALSATFLINGCMSQFRASLIRQLFFGKVAFVEVVSMLSGIVLAAVLATAGFGYWSLVVQQISQAAIALTIFIVLAGWRPMRPRRRHDTHALVQFGWQLMLAQVVNYISRNVDTVVVGYSFGASATGLYNRSSHLITSTLNQVNAPASTVAIPILSKLQPDRLRYDRYLSAGQIALFGVLGSVFSFCAFFSESVVAILLGPQWTDAVPIFRILSIAAIFQSLAYVSYWCFVTQAKTRQLLAYALVTRTVTCALVIFGATYSPLMVATMFAVGMAIIWPIGLFWIAFVGHLPVRSVITSSVVMLVLFTACSALSERLTAFLFDNHLVVAVVGILVQLVLVVAATAVIPALRRAVRPTYELFSLTLRQRFTKRPTSVQESRPA